MRYALRIAVIFCSVIIFPTHRVAATTIKYMEFPATAQQGDILNLPINLNVPCYGQVQVSITPIPPGAILSPVTFFHQTAAENQSPQNQPTYSWGTDTNRFSVLSGSTAIDYTITFTFLDGAPDSSRLLLVVVGLAVGTTATVSTSPASSPGNLLGEYHFPPPPTGGSSTTMLGGSVLSSGNDGDPKNTGWALYQPQTTATLASLSVTMHQAPGDGVGWTLAYICEGQAEPIPTLSGAALIFLGTLIAVIALSFVKIRLS
jgi:hypothetical protein